VPVAPATPEPEGVIPNPVYLLENGRIPIGPVLLERVCDHDKPLLTVEEVAERYRGGPANWGCGVRFRWYFGMQCICPGCSYQYMYNIEMLHQKKFWVNP
jgi:hypothetical protein